MDKNKFNISLREEEKELTETIKNLSEKLLAIQGVLKVYEKDFSMSKEKIDLFSSTTSNAPVKKFAEAESKKPYPTTNTTRVLEALELIKSGTAVEVANMITELYPDIPFEKARVDSRITLSRLKSIGKISGEQVPGQTFFLYSFIKQEEAALVQPQ